MTDFVLGHGPVPCKLMIVGEAPAVTECRTGIPLTGKTGDETNNLLEKFVGIRRTPIYASNGWNIIGVESDVYVTNLFKYPLNEKKQFTKEEYDWMGTLLREEIAKVNPEIILTLGAISTHWFLGDRYDMEALNAVPHMWEGRIIIPSFHPAATFRDTALLSWVIEAFEKTKIAINLGVDAETLLHCTPKPTRIGNGGSFSENLISVDTESLKDGSPYMVTWAYKEGFANFGYAGSGFEKRLAYLLRLKGVITLLHNALYDLPQLWKMKIYPARWIDTMHISFLLQTLPLGLKPLAYKLIGMKMRDYDEVVYGMPFNNWCDLQGIKKKNRDAHRNDRDLSDVSKEEREIYATQDADMTLRVYNKMLPLWYSSMGEILERDMDIMPMVIAMMQKGMKIDKPFLEDLGLKMEIENLELLEQIRSLAGDNFNPKSAQQVSKLLYQELQLGKGRRITKTKFGGTTGAKTLKTIEDEHFIVPMIEEYRSRKDLLDKYVNVLPKHVGKDGRIHANISMTRVAQSGRLASSNPNLLAQPVRTEDGRRIRDGFIPEDGYVLVSGDYNQIEMRLMAHLSQDPVLVGVYNNDGDVHTDTAMRIFGISDPSQVDEILHRYPSKRTGFLVIYRGTGMTLSKILMGEGLLEWTDEKCQWMIDRWIKEHEGVRTYWYRMDYDARRDGRVCDMYGRMKLIPEVYSSFPQTVESGLRKASNVPEQSTAQGIIKEAMRQMWPIVEEWGKDGMVYPLIQIHDSLEFEVKEKFVPEMVKWIKPIMEGVIELSVPVKVDFKQGVRWGTTEKIKEE